MNILIADDDAVSRRLMAVTLERLGYTVTAVKDGRTAWDRLKEPGGPPLAVLDWMMPGMTGLEVCRAVRKRSAPPYVYLILLTGRNRREDLIEGMAAGADDYLLKPVDPNELDVRLRAGRRVLDLQEALLCAQTGLKELSERDPLTGLYNRRAMEDLFQREKSRLDRNGRPLSLFIADVDHFKAINDTYGHAAGDGILLEIACRMTALFRGHDSVARWGGDEFLVFLPECGSAQALHIAERFRMQVHDTPFRISGGSVPCTTSIGLTTLWSRGPGDLAGALETADRALYRAKKNGRNRVDYQPGEAMNPKIKSA